MGAGVKVGREGREREGILRSGMDMDTEGREATEEEMRLKKDALEAGGGASGSDMRLSGRAGNDMEQGGRGEMQEAGNIGYFSM